MVEIFDLGILDTMADILLDKCAAVEKAAFVPGMPGGGGGAQMAPAGPADPAAAIPANPMTSMGQPMPTDPAQAAAMGAPGMMDPAMAQAAGPASAPPMDPAMMAGAPPMDPAMMAGAPPMDPAAGGAAPPPEQGGVDQDTMMSMMKMLLDQQKDTKDTEEQHKVPEGGSITVDVNDLRLFFTEVAAAIAHGPGGAPGGGGKDKNGDGKPDMATIKSVAKMEQVHKHLEQQLQQLAKQVQELTTSQAQSQAEATAATAAPPDPAAAGAAEPPVQSMIPGVQPLAKGVDMTIPMMAQQAMTGQSGIGGAPPTA